MSDESTTLFLGDLSVFCTEKDIRKLFRPFGTIEAIRVKRGSSSKTNLSYGFIKFSQRESAELALQQLSGIMFLGRALRIGWAEGKNSPKAMALQESKSVETAQVHVSFISKQVDILISEATLRALFGMYGEVVDVALKKSQFDRNLKIQNGYGFVHYPLTQEGIQAAFNAVASLHQVTIDRVTYDCSVSHALEGLIVPPTVTEVPKPPPPFLQQGGLSPSMRYSNEQQGQFPPPPPAPVQSSPSYGQSPHQTRNAMHVNAAYGNATQQFPPPQQQSMNYGGHSSRQQMNFGGNVHPRGNPSSLMQSQFTGGYEASHGYNQQGQYGIMNREIMERELTPYSSARGMQSVSSHQHNVQQGARYPGSNNGYHHHQNQMQSQYFQHQQHQQGVHNPRPMLDSRNVHPSHHIHGNQQNYMGTGNNNVSNQFDHHQNNIFTAGGGSLAYQEQEFNHQILRNSLKDDYRSADRNVRIAQSGDGFFESTQANHYDNAADTIFDFSQLSLAPSTSSSSAISEPSKFSTGSNSSSFHEKSPRTLNVGNLDSMSRSHSDIMISQQQQLQATSSESFLQQLTSSPGSSSNRGGNATYQVYPPAASMAGPPTNSSSFYGLQNNNDHDYQGVGNRVGDFSAHQGYSNNSQPSFQHTSANHALLSNSRSQSIEDIIDNDNQDEVAFDADNHQFDRGSIPAAFGSYRNHSNSDASINSAEGFSSRQPPATTST